MRLTSTCTLTLALLLSACNGGGGNTTDDTGTTPATPGTTEPATTGTGTSTSTATDPTTSGPGTTVEPTSTSSTTVDPDTDSTTFPGHVDTSSTSTTGFTSTGSTGDTTGSTTDESSSSTGTTGDTGMSGGDCMVDADCTLHNDCCNCYAIPVGQPDPICKKGCEQPTCDLLAIDQAVCRFGVCTTEKVNCDGSKVACDALPPDCPPGQVAQVTGVCWSGQCVDALSCNVVPECSYCPAGTMCVHKQAQIPTFPTCEPIPAECDGKIDCKCAGTFVCTQPFDACSVPGGNEIDCSCPAC